MSKGFFLSTGDVAARNRPRDARTAFPLEKHSDVFWKFSKVVSRGRRNSFVALPAHFCIYLCERKNTLEGLRQVVTKCKLCGRRGICVKLTEA